MLGGIILFIGNRTGAFPSVPFAGFVVMGIGALIWGAAEAMYRTPEPGTLRFVIDRPAPPPPNAETAKSDTLQSVFDRLAESTGATAKKLIDEEVIVGILPSSTVEGSEDRQNQEFEKCLIQYLEVELGVFPTPCWAQGREYWQFAADGRHVILALVSGDNHRPHGVRWLLYWEEDDPLVFAPRLDANFRPGSMIRAGPVVQWKSVDLLDDSPLARRRFEPWITGAPSHLPALIRELGQRDATIRQRTVKALGRMGSNAAGAVPALIRALDDQDENVRRLAVEALGRIGPPAAAALPRLQNLSLQPDYNQCVCWAYNRIAPGSVSPLV